MSFVYIALLKFEGHPHFTENKAQKKENLHSLNAH